MLVIPSLDLQAGRSRLVWWPGAATGAGAPTDRPERIARWFVEAGAPLIHLVDLDGGQQGRPANLASVADVARAVAVPLQLAGGLDGPEQIELAFAAGATRVVVPLWAVAEDSERLRACLAIAGDWLAVGLDGRSERLARYPWRSRVAPTLDEIVGELVNAGVRRFVISHTGAAPDLHQLASLAGSADAEILVAGGVADVALVPALRDAGVRGVILGEAMFTGAVDFRTALALAA
jgi:phosphoribosylformimino-5-aminoimidazole carboxamide ribotide isomerase